MNPHQIQAIPTSSVKNWLWVFHETWEEHIGQEPQVQCKYDIPKIINDKVKSVEFKILTHDPCLNLCIWPNIKCLTLTYYAMDLNNRYTAMDCSLNTKEIPLTLMADNFTAPWTARMHSISFESLHWAWLSGLLVESVAALLMYVLSSKIIPTKLYIMEIICKRKSIAEVFFPLNPIILQIFSFYNKTFEKEPFLL